MNKLKIGLLFIIIFSSLINTKNANSQSFSQASITLDRIKSGSALSGVVCASPSSAAPLEDAVSIVFPNDFTINSQASNFSISTNNLPGGSSVWTGIGSSAQSVSSQTITISSSDLSSSSTRYCFRFTASSSTIGSTGSKSITILTKTSSNSTIDSTVVKTQIISNDQVAVTATVPADANDYNVNITRLYPTSSSIEQDTHIGFRITYSTNFYYPSDITLEAEWGLGTLSGESVANVDIVDYVTDSAGVAYNNTPPVVDLIGRKIRWTISALPGPQAYNVSFNLKTNNDHLTSLPISFPVTARIYGLSAQSPDSTLNLIYLRNFNYLTPGPTNTPAPIPPPSPTPEPRFFISTVDMYSLSTTEAEIAIRFNQKAKSTIYYGRDIRNLNNSITSPDFASAQRIKITNLQPDTSYYFRVSAVSQLSRRQSTGLYTFRTAKIGDTPKYKDDSLIISSERTIVYSPPMREENSKYHIIKLPTQTFYTIQIAFENPELIKKVDAQIQSDKVLGIFFPEKSFAYDSYINLTKIKNGIYSAKLISPPIKDQYNLLLRVEDYNGSISVQNSAIIKTSSPITILDQTKKPIESALVKLYLLDEKTQIYKLLTKEFLNKDSTLKSDFNGVINQVLPHGKYKAEISAIGYKNKEVVFKLGPNKNEDYPTITMHSDVFNPLNIINYLSESALEAFVRLDDFISSFSKSYRFFNLINIFGLFIFAILSYLSFLERIKLPLSHVLSHAFHNTSMTFKRSQDLSYLRSKISDSTSKIGIKDAHIFILDEETQKILHTTTSNKNGEFSYPQFNKPIQIEILRKDYDKFKKVSIDGKIDDEIFINLDSNTNILSSIIKILRFSIERVFELSIIFGFILQIIFILNFGVIQTLPFFAFSALNILLYINHKKLTR